MVNCIRHEKILWRYPALDNVNDEQLKVLSSESFASFMLRPCLSPITPSQWPNTGRYKERLISAKPALFCQQILTQGLAINLAKTFLKLCYNLTLLLSTFLPSVTLAQCLYFLTCSDRSFCLLQLSCPPPQVSISSNKSLTLLYLFQHLFLWGPELIVISIGMKLRC